MSRDGFLSRWSKLKQEARREEPQPERLSEDRAEDAGPSDAALADEEAISDEELALLPPVEEVTEPAALAGYLRKGVPLAMRNAAMRRMWVLDPAIRDFVDVALDYAYDWNTPGGVPGSGLLPEGYDAKGAAERFLSDSPSGSAARTEHTDAVPEEAVAARDDAPGEDQVTVQPAAEERKAPLADAAPAEGSTTENSTLVESADVAAPKEARQVVAEQAPARRHGGALPV